MKEQIEQMKSELRNLRLQVSAPVPEQTKDLSLVGLIPKFSGSDKAVSVKYFFDTVESTAAIGNWSDSDKIPTIKLYTFKEIFISIQPIITSKRIKISNVYTWKVNL
jgi:hypothetical protein